MKLPTSEELIAHQELENLEQIGSFRIQRERGIAAVFNVKKGSGIFSGNDSLYYYALNARFDLIIEDKKTGKALVAIEVDGSSHETDHKTKINDKKKETICRYFKFPLLRIEHSYLAPVYPGGFSLFQLIVRLYK